MKNRFIFVLPIFLAVLSCVRISGFYSPAVTLVLAPSPSAKWDEDSFQQARGIFEERLNHANLSVKSDVIVSGNNILVDVYRSIDLETIASLCTEVGAIYFVDSATGYPEGEKIALSGEAVLTQADVESVTVTRDQLGKHQLMIEFTREGGRKLADYTKNNVGRYLVIVKDGSVISSPSVQAEIPDGSALITANFSLEEINTLAIELQGPPLPFELVALEVKKPE